MPSDDPDIRTYAVTGELFFASSNDLIYQFDYTDAVSHVVIDLSAAHIWDASTVATLDAITTKFQAKRHDRDDRGPQRQQRTTPPQAPAVTSVERSARPRCPASARTLRCKRCMQEVVMTILTVRNLDRDCPGSFENRPRRMVGRWKPRPARYSGRRGTPDDQPGRSVRRFADDADLTEDGST